MMANMLATGLSGTLLSEKMFWLVMAYAAASATYPSAVQASSSFLSRARGAYATVPARVRSSYVAQSASNKFF
jgi:hypothetical protein